jgi:hypothetical protein
MKLKKNINYNAVFFYNAFYCCAMTYFYSTTGGFWQGVAATISFVGYSAATVQIYRYRNSQLLLDKSDKLLTE